MQKDVLERLHSEEVQSYIRLNEHANENEIVLRSRSLFGVPSGLIADQIYGLRKAKTKLPTYYNNPFIIYPPKVNLEQSSSEKTATLKTLEIIAASKGQNAIVDLTGGFGVDSFGFSKHFSRVTYVEPNKELFKIAQINHHHLNASNIQHVNAQAEYFLKSFRGDVDVIYVDPSRRSSGNRRVFTFRDCEPDVVEIRELMLKHSGLVVVKASPLLDLKSGMESLKTVHQVIVISVDNECKEVLFFVHKHAVLDPLIKAVNLTKSGKSEFKFNFSDEARAVPAFSAPQQFLYEPNASILKAGAFRLLGTTFGLSKLHANTHLYTSASLVPDFPGRVFSIKGVFKNSPQTTLEYFPDLKANVMVRNYPSSVDEVKSKLKLTDGGDNYLIATTSITGKNLIALTRIK